jgi:ABC-2 type transport system ATP-binding protein
MSVNDGVGILLCTHLLDDVDRLCTHLGILSGGETVLEGPVADLLAGRRAAARYRLRVPTPESAVILPAGVRVASRSGEWWHVELSGAGDPATAWRELLDSGLRVEEIHQEGGGLEELYLAVTETKEAV